MVLIETPTPTGNTKGEPTTSPSQTIQFFGSSLLPAVAASEELAKFTCMASIRVPDDDIAEDAEINENDRAPVLVVAVVDKSGSMNGDKMKSLRETLKFVISELGKKDKLAIVEYDAKITTTLPVTLMDEAGKQRANAVCKAIKAGSTTNLSGGLMQGLRLIPDDVGAETVVSTLLLTDGLANVGIRTADGIVAMVRKAQTDGVGRCSVNTFGFGSDHDATMLTTIAQASEGMYYYIENVDSIAGAFADCIGGLLSVRAQGVELEIEAVAGMGLSEVFTTKEVTTVEPNRKVRLALGDLQNGEERDITFEVSLPKATAPCETQQLVACRLSYFDMTKNEMVELKTEVAISRPDAPTVEQKKPNLLVDRNCNRVKVARATTNALKCAKEGNLAQGREELQRAIADVSSAPTAKEQFCEVLLEEMETSLAGMKDMNQYKQQGQFHMNRCSHKMWHQRAADAEYDVVDEMMEDDDQMDDINECMAAAPSLPKAKASSLFATKNRSRMKKKAYGL